MPSPADRNRKKTTIPFSALSDLKSLRRYCTRTVRQRQTARINRATFLKKVCQLVSLIASPKHPQSETGFHNASTNVSSVKKDRTATVNPTTIRSLIRNSRHSPNDSSNADRITEKAYCPPASHDIPNAWKYSPDLIAVPQGSIPFDEPGKDKHKRNDRTRQERQSSVFFHGNRRYGLRLRQHDHILRCTGTHRSQRTFRTAFRSPRPRTGDPTRLVPRPTANGIGKYSRTLPIHENMQSSIANVGFLFGSDNFSFRGIFLTGNPFGFIVFGSPNRRPSSFLHGTSGLPSNDSPAIPLIVDYTSPYTELPIEVRNDRRP